MRRTTIAALAALVLLLVAFVGAAGTEPARGLEPAQAQQPRALTVSGYGTARTVPDLAELSLAVVSEGANARAALGANSTELQRVIDALRQTGIQPADIQTHDLVLSRVGEGEAGSYSVENTVRVLLRDLTRAGAVIDAAVGAGVKRISNPVLKVSDTSQLYRGAVRAAVADAREKAQALAAASGVTLGAILNISESTTAPFTVPAPGERGGAAAPGPIQPGTQAIEAIAAVTFALS